jgi:hypothetical protein
MNEKEIGSRRLIIALEIVCIILIACLVVATLSYSLQNNDKDNTISSLKSQITNANNEISQLEYPYINTTILNWTNNEAYGNEWVDVYLMAFNTGNISGAVSLRFTLYIAPHSVDENLVAGTNIAVFSVEPKSFYTLFYTIFYTGETNITDVTATVFEINGQYS